MSALEAIEIDTGPQPDTSIIFLHGLGADGNDFASLVDQLDISRERAVRFIFPHAPRRPVTINGGYVMRAWFDIINASFTLREDEASLRQSQVAVDDLLTQECSRGIKPSRIVLAGFSQGCAMSLMVGLRHAESLGGIVGLSGYLPLALKTQAERSAANRKAPIFLAHGRNDPVVPHAAGVASRDVLLGLGYSVEWHEYAMEHSVCPEEIGDLNRWFSRVLRPAD